jgi:hypothetical protein
MFFFIVGYLVHILFYADIIELPVDSLFMTTLVYFFGAVFVIVTIDSISDTVTSILGKEISDDEALQMFAYAFGLDESEIVKHKFPLECSSCNENIDYSIADVVRNNINHIHRGITVQTTFGVRSFILRPTHRCTDGRREVTVIHDDNLSFRSVDQSRIIIGGEL